MKMLMSALTANPLDQLHDIKLPEPVSAWPLAPGWWLVALLVLSITGYLAWLVARTLPHILWRRRVLQALPEVTRDPHFFSRLNAWLKRTAGECYPQAGTDALTGEHWIDFLHATAPDLVRDDLARLTQSALTPAPLIAPEAAQALAVDWLRRQPCSH